MRTTTANFKAAFAKGDCSPVVVARLYFRDLDSGVGVGVKSWDVCSGPIDGTQEWSILLGEASFGLKEKLLSMTQLGSTLDPKTRAISTGDLSLTVDGWDEVFNELVPNPSSQADDQTWRGKLVRVYLAERELSDPADWLPIFHGSIHDATVDPDSNSVQFECKTIDAVFNESAFYGGTFYRQTPLATAYKILTYALTRVDVSRYDLTLDGDTGGASFDQSNAEFNNTASWAVTNLAGGIFSGGDHYFERMYGASFRLGANSQSLSERVGAGDAPLTSEFPGPLPQHSSRRGMAAVLPLVNLLLRPYMASVYFDGGGVLRCRTFKKTTDLTLGQGHYASFSQSSGYSESIINKLVIEQSSPDAMGGDFEFSYTNQASLDKYGERQHIIPSFPFMRSELWPIGYDDKLVEVGNPGAYFTRQGLQGMTGITTSPASVGETGKALYGPWGEVFEYTELSRLAPSANDLVLGYWHHYSRWHFQYSADGYLIVENNIQNDPGYPANRLDGSGSVFVSGTTNAANKLVSLSASARALSGSDFERIQPHDQIAFRDPATGTTSAWLTVAGVIGDDQIALQTQPAVYSSFDVLILRNQPYPKFLKLNSAYAVNVTGRNINNTGGPAEGATLENTDGVNTVYDMTQAYHYADKILDRFTCGAPTASVEIPLEFASLEIGDVIELEGEAIAWEGYSVGDSIKWEVTSIEFNPLADVPALRLSLCVVEHSGPASYYLYDTDLKPGGRYIKPSNAGTKDTGRPHVSRPPNPFGYDSHMRDNAGILGGCGPSINYVSGQPFPRDLAFKKGTISNGAIGLPFESDPLYQATDADGFPLGPEPIRNYGSILRINRDNFQPDHEYKIFGVLEGGAIDVLERPKSNPLGLPFLDLELPGTAAICGFTTDASGDPETSSIVDLRDLGTVVEKQHLSPSAGGANLDFEDFPDNVSPPANWIGYPSRSWSFLRSTESPRAGKNCLHYNAGFSDPLVSTWFPVKESQPYKLTAWHNPTTATSKVIETIISAQFADRNKQNITAPFPAINLAGATVGTWYQNKAQGNSPTGACFARVQILRSISGGAGANANDAVLLDSVSLELQGAPKEERGDFVDLADTPDSLSGQDGKSLQVNTSGNALELIDTRPRYSKAWLTTNMNFPINTDATINFGGKIDPFNSFNLTTDRWDCPVDGVYRITYDLFSNVPGFTSITESEIRMRGYRYTSGGSQTTIIECFATYSWAWNSTGFRGALDIELTTSNSIDFSIINFSSKSGAVLYGASNGLAGASWVAIEKVS